jgi:hypothetical protein
VTFVTDPFWFRLFGVWETSLMALDYPLSFVILLIRPAHLPAGQNSIFSIMYPLLPAGPRLLRKVFHEENPVCFTGIDISAQKRED